MSKTKVIALSLLIVLSLAPFAMAQTSSFTMAAMILKTFDKDTKALLPKSLDKEERKTFTKSRKALKRETHAKIKWLRRSEGPSPKRFSRLYRILEKYTENQVREVSLLAERLKEPQKSKVEDMGVKLQALREKLLKEFKDTSYSEIKPDDRFKPDPVIDRSPYEERPGDTRGIYDR